MNQFSKKILEFRRDESSMSKARKWLARSFRLTWEETEETISDVMIDLYVKDARGKLPPVKHFKSYFYQCLENRIIEVIKNKKRERIGMDTYFQKMDTEDEIERMRVINNNMDYILRNLKHIELNEISRFIFLKYHCDAMSFDEIYQILIHDYEYKDSPNTLRVNKHRTCVKIYRYIIKHHPNFKTDEIFTQTDEL